MELMRQCPNCGKAVSADRTYCMHCGTTLGVKCEACGKVVPLQTKVCACGHSFVKRTKKVRSGKKLLPSIKQRAKPILLCVMALVMLLTVIFAALPSVGFYVGRLKGTVFVEDNNFLSGFSLISFFLGGHPADANALLTGKVFEDGATPIRLWMYLEGFAWLVLLVTFLLLVILVIPNARRMGKATARRMIPLAAVAAGSSAVLFGADKAISAVMTPLAQEMYPTVTDAALSENATRWSVGSSFPLVVLILIWIFFALHMVMYLWAFRKVEEPEAKSLKVIFKSPFVALKNAIRNRPKSKKRKQKQSTKKRSDEEDERSIICTSRFTPYLILLGFSLIFTQALLSKISNIFFWFVFLLPLPSLVYTLIARAALKVEMISESTTTEKNQPYTYEFHIKNRSPLAFPFIDAKVSIPQSNSVRCTNRSVRLSMAPMSSYHMKNTVCFRFRGTYEIGVRCFYVYDFFRLFRVRVPVTDMTTVYVLPRRLGLEDTLAQAVSDSTARTVKSPLVVDRLEVSDIRDYQNGDSLKSIHWKLSSKSENFIVKDYNTGTSNQTVIFCDMAGHFPDEPPKSMMEPEETAGVEKRKLSPEEKAEARAEKKAKKAEAKAEKKQASKKDETRAAAEKTAPISDEVQVEESADNAKPAPGSYDVHRLAKPAHYEDMNEYLADGVVELTVASVLAELRQGHDVTLLWFDPRSDAGLYAFAVRGISEFEGIYHLFATAPLCGADKRVSHLTAMISDIESTKQLFVTSTMDQTMLSELAALPGVSDAGNFGSAEVILYNPEDRFLYPAERASYLEGCRETLSANGLSLRTSGMIAVRQEGGEVS